MRDVVAVTGASGLIGRHLCDHFRGRGYEVRALVRRPNVYPFRQCGIQTYRCDLPDRIDREALVGADVVIHCAYATRSAHEHAARLINEHGTLAIREAARTAGVSRFVFISSIAADPRAPTYYGRSKHELEQLQDPRRDLNLRPGLVLARDGGLFARAAEWVRGARLIPLFDGGRQRLQTVHVDDLCDAVEAALASTVSDMVTVAHPEPIAFRDLLTQVARLSGRRCVLLPIPAAPALWLLQLLDRLPFPVPVSAENLRGLMATRQVDTSADLARLGLCLRGPEESLRALFGDPTGTGRLVRD